MELNEDAMEAVNGGLLGNKPKVTHLEGETAAASGAIIENVPKNPREVIC